MSIKHYIRINEKDEIIKMFSNTFEPPQNEDILIAENESSLIVDFLPGIGDLFDFNSKQYIYKYDGEKIVKKTYAEIWTTEATMNKQKELVRSTLKELDSDTIRVIEDVIDVLVSKNVIKHSDLPVEVVNKLNNRKALREQLQ